MSGVLRLPKGWTAWPRELGVGFSFSRDDVKSDVDRDRNPDTGLIEWRSRTWVGTGRADAEHVYHGQDLTSAWAIGGEATV